MTDKSGFQLRWDLIILDGIGTILFALGLAKVLGIDMLPSAWQFDRTGWLMLIVGVLLMLPFMLNILGQVRNRTEGKRF
ncbi:MAG: DUF1418 family protein [Alphaproteobacteria bacterium]|nr:DUF1418 family protein [Alphaproteobacteria bacterium]